MILGIFLAAPVTTILVGGCSTTQPGEADPNSAEGMFKTANELESDDRYDEAISKLNELKNKFPYSHFATDAELKVADIHYKRETYIESQTAYQLFKDFHPKHPKSDYVTFRLALSYFNQLPGSIDRDLGVAQKAIQFFKEVETSYAKSEYVKEAKEKEGEAYKMLAGKEMYIANFYYVREVYDSAQRRFEGLLAKYPDRGFDDEALYKAGISAFEQGSLDVGAKYINQLVSQHPNSDYADKGKSALEKYGRR